MSAAEAQLSIDNPDTSELAHQLIKASKDVLVLSLDAQVRFVVSGTTLVFILLDVVSINPL